MDEAVPRADPGEGQPVAAAPLGEAGRIGASPAVRACGALALITVAGALLIANAEPIVLTLIGLASSAPSDFAVDTAFRVLLPSIMTLLALAAAWLFGHAIRVGRERPVWTATAFPAGFGAVTLILLPVAVADGIGTGSGSWSLGALLFGSLVVLFAALAEELLLRGVLQPVLARAWGLWTAVLMSAASFTAMHIAGGWRDPVTLANIFLASIWFGLLAERTGGLLAPTLAHFGYNWSEELVFGATPNPGVGSYGALFDLELTGGTRLGGSVEGMNASPILTLALIVLVVILLLDVRRRAAPASGPAQAPGATAIRRGTVRP